jgi:pimeloyl-ACP methyl ester carboxylesterase
LFAPVRNWRRCSNSPEPAHAQELNPLCGKAIGSPTFFKVDSYIFSLDVGLDFFHVQHTHDIAVTPPQQRLMNEVNREASGLGSEFAEESATTDRGSLHYVRGGHGPAMILIHGFPQDWSEYRVIMPRLAKYFTVIAIDLPGIGGSTSETAAYEAANLAEDVRQLMIALKLDRAYIVGHDIGGMVAYAFVRRYPESSLGAMIFDQVLPGIDGWKEIEGHPAVWHIRFMQVPGLAEELVTGRQAHYLGYFLNFGKFQKSEVKEALRAYATPAQLHAAFEIYRAFPANGDFNAAQSEPFAVPVFVAAGDASPFAKLLPQIADGLRAKGCSNVKTSLIADCGHYVIADQPDSVASLIEEFGGSRAGYHAA